MVRISRSRKWKRVGAVVATVLVIVGWWLYRPLPPAQLVVSQRTTVYAGPANPDGTIDYVAAVNREMGEGVAPSDNAFIAVARTVPEWVSEAQREAVFERLGVPLPGEDEARFREFEAFAQERGWRLKAMQSESGLLPDVDGRAVGDAWMLEDDEAEAPLIDAWSDDAWMAVWRAEDHPLIAAWLEANGAVLDEVSEALRKPEWFAPWWSPSDPPTVMTVLLPHLGYSRKLGQALGARARRVAEGELELAWRDVLAMERLGRHLSNERLLIGVLVGMSLRTMAYQVIDDLVMSEHFTADRARSMLAQWRALPEPAPLADVLDRGERVAALDIVMEIWRASRNPAALESPVQHDSLDGGYDPNPALRRVNAHFDELVEIARSERYPDYARRMQRSREPIDDELDREWAWRENWGSRVAMVLAPRGKRRELRTRWVNAMLWGTILPTFELASKQEWRLRMRQHLAELALAMGAYRADHGAWPARLEALAPVYLEAVPRDLFNGEPLRYERGEGAAVIYSVGPNMTDDGGDADDQGGDVVLRLAPAHGAM